jgi:excisionase family DNA binding protein
MDSDQKSELLTPSEVGQMLRVNPKTVTRWARAGKLPAIKTTGGHRRFRRSDVEQAVAQAAHDSGEESG